MNYGKPTFHCSARRWAQLKDVRAHAQIAFPGARRAAMHLGVIFGAMIGFEILRPRDLTGRSLVEERADILAVSSITRQTPRREWGSRIKHYGKRFPQGGLLSQTVKFVILSALPMLTIRPDQMRSLAAFQAEQFLDRSTDDIARRWAGGVMTAGSRDETRVRVADSVGRARALGFRDRGHLTTWLDWECAFGPAFYEDPAWEWANDILQNGLDPAIRIYRIENRLAVLRERGLL